MASLKFAGIMLMVFLCWGCETGSKTETSKKEKKKLEGLVQHFRKDGTLASEITYKEKKKHGLAKGYYKSGVLRSEIMYDQDVQHGIARQYYANGNLYRETPYTKGEIDGVLKTHRESGKLLAEIPYKNGQLGVGTVEYTSEGKPKKQLPKIKVEHINNVIKNNQYIVRVYLTEGYKNATYYLGDLTEGKYKNHQLVQMKSEKGVLEIKYPVYPGRFIMETINIVAETKTQMRSPYLLQQKINVAAENKGY